MNTLASIPVRVEVDADASHLTRNLEPVLQQTAAALRELRQCASRSVIDLGAMPFSAADERALRDLLGRGEVSATVEAFGPTLVQETACRGVWLIEHQDAGRRRLTLHIEVARVPEILVTPQADLADSLAALERLCQTPAHGPDVAR